MHTSSGTRTFTAIFIIAAILCSLTRPTDARSDQGTTPESASETRQAPQQTAGNTTPNRAGPAQRPAVPADGPTWQTVTPPSIDPPPVRIEPDIIDLGDLMPETKVQTEFKVTNIGDKPLKITSAMSTCSCTVAQLGISEIEPGRTIILPVTFDSGKVIADQTRDVIIRFAGYARPAAGKVHARTNYGVRMMVEYDPPEQRRVANITLESVDEQPFRVLSAGGRPPQFLDGFDPLNDAPRNRYIIAQDLAGIPAQSLPLWFVIELDHPTSPIIDLPVENLEWAPERTMRPWSFSERRILLGEMPPMSQKEVVVLLRNVKEGGLDLIRSIWMDPPIAEAAIFGMEQTPDGLKVRVRITPRDDHRGAFVTALSFSALDFDDSITLMGRITE